MILYLLDPDGGFTVGDKSTGATAYAYPTSTHATQAKTKPAKVAAAMIREANRQAALLATFAAAGGGLEPHKPIPDYIREYHARNFDRLHKAAETVKVEG